MTYRLQQAETRQCKGCGVDFQTDDGRKWFHKPSCGRAKVEKQTNAWLLANRSNFPTEPCLTCGSPVVQYRNRRYDGEMRYCNRSCQPRPKQPLAKAQWPPIKYGQSCRISKGCRECGTGQKMGLCRGHRHQRYSLRQMIWTRLRWLLPRTCNQCGQDFQRFESASLCLPCLRHNYAAQRKWGKIKRKHRMTGGASSISPTRLYERDDRMCALCHRATDHPRVWEQWVANKRWMPNAPTVDHIIPLAKGGTHTWDNVQLAHWSCNSDKSDSLVTRAPKIIKGVRGTVPSDEFVNLLYGVEPA